MKQALDFYAEVLEDQPGVSLNSFSRDVGLPYWKLRDARLNAQREKARQTRRELHLGWVREMALANPTYGYRRIHLDLVLLHGQATPGRHEVRIILRELGLIPAQPRKTKRPAFPVTAATIWPEGRRVQIDATRFSFQDGVSWVYVVLDVETRAVLHLEVVRNLSASSAVTALHSGIQILRDLGIAEKIVVMSDGGSDFTSLVFQQACLQVGCWVRAKVSQRGGMGILERVNRTLKYEWVFRYEVRCIAELRARCAEFQDWYNHRRRHSTIGYAYPWDKLMASAKTLFAA